LELQRELSRINGEFSGTEADGLALMPVQRGEIYLVDLNPIQGREQTGRRPVLVLS